LSGRGWSARVRFIEFWRVIVVDFLASKMFEDNNFSGGSGA
jgi:hypothetical protein